MHTHFITSLEFQREKIQDFSLYPFCLDAIKNLECLEFHPEVTFFVGENGSGKSTLLEAIAVQYGFNPEGGSKNFVFKTYTSHSELEKYIRIAKGIKKPRDGYFLRAESFYNVASEIENLDKEGGGPPIIDSYGGTSLHEQSHGESFFSLFLHRLFGNGIYIFDEPEAALSPQRQLTFLSRMHELIKEKSQFIIATHSPIILAYPGAKIFQFGKSGIQEISFKETEHYILYKLFLENPNNMLNKLGILGDK